MTGEEPKLPAVRCIAWLGLSSFEVISSFVGQLTTVPPEMISCRDGMSWDWLMLTRGDWDIKCLET
jgi:hypothetical protein